MVIASADLEQMVDNKLDDMGLADPDMGHRETVRAATKQYYLGLVKEHLANTTDAASPQLLDDLEGFVMGFVDGYRDGFRAGLES